jgi:cobalt-zinc-cadmium resistance protein CzcA
MKQIPGAADVSTEQVTGQPMLQIEVDRQATALRHLRGDVLEVIERTRDLWRSGSCRRGSDGSRSRSGSTTAFALTSAVGRILVTAANGDRIPLSRLAKIQMLEGSSMVNREWASGASSSRRTSAAATSAAS